MKILVQSLVLLALTLYSINSLAGSDEDGVPDDTDNCPSIANADQLDTDSDGVGNECDDDDDGDGVADSADAFPLDATETLDTDADGTGNNADLDDDSDGAKDTISQMGPDLDGTFAGGNFGTVALSSDGSVLAVGAFAADSARGVVRVYSWNPTFRSWSQIGLDIVGDNFGDVSGYSLALSDDGIRLAVGAASSAGQVRVFEWDGTAWSLLGDRIVGVAGDYFGLHVDLSADGGVLAATAPSNDSNGENSGQTKIFNWDSQSQTWVQLGGSITGEGVGDEMGAFNVSLSSTGQTIAIGAWQNDGAGEDSGHTRVFDWDGLQWLQRGSDIDGVAAGDRSGTSVSINSSGTMVAIGAPFNDAINENSGRVRVYEWIETENVWSQKGQNIDGEVAACSEGVIYSDSDGDGVTDSCGDESGWSSSISGDGLLLAIGAWKNDGNGDRSGHTRIYAWRDQTNRWEQVGEDLDGERSGDQSGWKTKLSRDGTVLVVGAFGNDDGGANAGHARVFNILKNGDAFPLDATESIDTDFDGTGNNADTDDDGDGVADASDAFPLDATETVDTDLDGTGNNADTDDDNDGIADTADAFPLDATETLDTDADGVGDNSDVFPSDASESIDTDGDRVGDNADNCPSVANADQINVDGDGAGDLCDPDFDPDGDGIPNENLIVGDWRLNGAASLKVGPVPLDGSWYSVSEEEVLQRSCQFDDIFRFNADGTFNNIFNNQTWLETWQGVENAGCFVPVAPHDGATSATWELDTAQNTLTVNGKGAFLGMQRAVNAGDLYNDISVPDWVKYQIESLGNNGLFTTLTLYIEAGAGVFYTFDLVKAPDNCPSTVNPSQLDSDGDGLGDVCDSDDDGDGVLDTADAFPLISLGSLTDADGDGRPNACDSDCQTLGMAADTDDDGDGVADGSDAFPLDSSESVDTDSDGIGNNADTDDDADGVADTSDAFPLDATENLDTDSDGTGNNADTDDDGDGSVDQILKLGNDIDGQKILDLAGRVALSSDSNRLAVGSYNASSGRGAVSVYQWQDDRKDWVQLGEVIQGENPNDYLGYSMALSADGSVIAIGALGNYFGDGVEDTGHIRVYDWDGTTWIQRGLDVNGKAAGDNFGWHVSLSADGKILAGSAPYSDGGSADEGQVRVFAWDAQSNLWVQLGSDINGEGEGDQSGAYNVSLSSDGVSVAIGAWLNDGSGQDSGHVRVFDWNQQSWAQRGADIDGEAAGDRSGTSVSLSGDGNIVAIGAPGNDGNGENSGQVRVYTWSSLDSGWLQQGQDIDGEHVPDCERYGEVSDTDGDGLLDSCGDESGWSSSLSGDGLTLAVGAWKNDGNGRSSGHTRVYVWDEMLGRWKKLGRDIVGEAPEDQSGWDTAIDASGSVIAIGAWNNGLRKGHARAFQISVSGDAFPLDATEILDTDADGTGNNADTDDDGDGVLDTSDAFPLDAAESTDTDADGTGNNADIDDDGDGVADTSDAFPLDANETLDTDADGTGNNADTDDDGDGVADSADAFPLDATETLDTDADGTGNNADTDDDGDGVADIEDTFPLDANETLDTDSDGTGNNADTDDDGDGVADSADAFPLDATETLDTDADGTGNNADTDDDGDGVLDTSDAFPLDTNETVDTDADGTGNNADIDDDGDGVADTSDAFPLDATETLDTDSDGTGNNADTDDDGDDVLDTSDAFPLDTNETVDTDSDGTGNNADTDDDGDGVADSADAFPLDSTETLDTDADGVGDNSDAFPSDARESIDTDGDQVGDNADNCPNLSNADQLNTDGDIEGDACDLDDDNDGFSDQEELAAGTDPLGASSCPGCFNWDIDDDGEATALTDGLIMIRHLFGFGGDSLSAGAMGAEAGRATPDAISSHLTDANTELDVDGDGESKALTDGLLLIRYLFGFTGDSLISGAIGDGAERDTAEEVEAYIEERLPPSP